MTKVQLDKEIKELSVVSHEMGPISDSEAFDIADSFAEPHIISAIKKHYPKVTDYVGFIASHI